jgi:hypothetical protein
MSHGKETIMIKHNAMRISAAMTVLFAMVVVGATQALALRPDPRDDQGSAAPTPPPRSLDLGNDLVLNWALIVAITVGVIAAIGLAYSLGRRHHQPQAQHA